MFDSWDVKCLLSLFKCLSPASSLSNFKFTWKTTTVLALVIAKCSDLTLMYIDNQYSFLQCHTAIFVPLSLPQIYIQSCSMLIICLYFT